MPEHDVSHDGEGPVIDRCDFGQPETLGDGNNRRVDDAQRKIQMSVHQFGHARDVVVFGCGWKPTCGC